MEGAFTASAVGVGPRLPLILTLLGVAALALPMPVSGASLQGFVTLDGVLVAFKRRVRGPPV